MGLINRDDEKDQFWDLDALIQKRNTSATMKSFASSIQPVETVSEAAEPPERKAQDALRITASPAASASAQETEVREYKPIGNRLLQRVRITRRKADYNFYGQFCRDAEKYLLVEGEECSFAPFFSYIPQYAQLTEAQRSYYFYWRTAMRRGEYLKTEESYFYLYVYEIINLPNIIMPNDGIKLLCEAWAAYREAFPRIDKFMTQWVCDYCLVHALPCPEEYLRPFLAKILPLADLREFYLGGMGDFSPRGVETALAFFSNYRWQDSRYAAAHRELFEKHMIAAVTPVLQRLLADAGLFEATCSHKGHGAFCGSLCAYHVKCHIDVFYYALNDVASLREKVTAAVKYAENKLRAVLAVKSRLAAAPLEPSWCAMIDDYFAASASQIAPVPKAEKPAYEQLYDAKTKGVDFLRASQIEQSSWATTKILTEEKEEPKAEEKTVFQQKNGADSGLADSNAAYSAAASSPKTGVAEIDGSTANAAENDKTNADTPQEREGTYLSCLLRHDRNGIRALLASFSGMEEELAESINEKALAQWGDIVLVPGEDGYQLIEDYEQEVSEWILATKRT